MSEPEYRVGKTPVVVVAGPTASGKSSLALAIAGSMNGVVINADSMQVYRDLRILTARPSPEDEQRAPHRLFGTLDGDDVCSVGRWRAMAMAEIQQARAHGQLPVMVGGTGLYLKALMFGLAQIPAVPADVVARARIELKRLGAPAFHTALAAKDPVMAARLKPGDSQRLVRAASVLEATGRSLADWQAGQEQSAADLAFHVVLLIPPRQDLYAICDARFDTMLAQGAVEEVRTLRMRQLAGDRPVMKAIGVRPLGAMLDGDLSLDEAKGLAQRSTRNYAKRQLTWFRHQIIADQTAVEKFSERNDPEIFSKIRQFLLTHET